MRLFCEFLIGDMYSSGPLLSIMVNWMKIIRYFPINCELFIIFANNLCVI